MRMQCWKRGRCVTAAQSEEVDLYLVVSPILPSFMTPLHVAAERAHNDIMEVLQKHGAKVSESYFS